MRLSFICEVGKEIVVMCLGRAKDPCFILNFNICHWLTVGEAKANIRNSENEIHA
ncbi:hypothetical protein Tco_1481881, partial [Tanacetum coccineum]